MAKKTKKPPIDKPSVMARLERAHADRFHVSVRRWIPEAERSDGFVVALGAKWVALATVVDLRLNGWCLLRIKDIQAVVIDPDPDCLEIRVLKARDQWPPTSPDLDLDTAVGAISSAAACAPMTTLYTEFHRPDICWIGSVEEISAGSVTLREIDTQAVWRRKPRTIDLGDVTQIGSGGDYERALALVAESGTG